MQLVKGDSYNQAVGLCAAFVLACLKEVPGLDPLVQWQLNAYTNWNLTFIALRVALRQPQWDPFLLVNSMGVCCGFRTVRCPCPCPCSLWGAALSPGNEASPWLALCKGFAQGLDENLRHKVLTLGLRVPRPLFMFLDHVFHSLPPVLLTAELVRRQERVPKLNVVYALTLASWFSFRQQAKLDASQTYVPHPWRRTWLAIVAGMCACPSLVDGLISRKRSKLLAAAALILVPYLTSKFDPGMRQKYNFEYRLQTVGGEAALLSSKGSKKGQGRAMSEACLSEVRRGS